VLKTGERVGEWVVEAPLGEGGMGAVYRVHSALTRRLLAALKVMKPTTEPDARARFVREAEALSALRHPAVVRVMGFNEDPERGLLYLVMELAVGETLRARMSRGPMPLPEALATFVPLAQGLDHAHSEGIFHRDLKPANVVLTNDGTPRLVDFGIAAAREAESFTTTNQLGTLPYLPPEVFRGERAEPAAIDVYAFGLLIHEALTGRRPFALDPGLPPTAASAAVGVLKLQAPALELPAQYPERLRDLVRRATDPDPKARPPMREVRETLESLVERRGSPSEPGRLVAAAPAVMVPDDVTTRVPDPTPPGATTTFLGGESTTGTRTRGRRRQDRLRGPLVAAAATAAVFLVGLGLTTIARRPAKETVSSPAPPPVGGPAARTPAKARPIPSSAPTPAPTRAPSPAAKPAPTHDPLALPTPSALSTRPAPSPARPQGPPPVERVQLPPPEPPADPDDAADVPPPATPPPSATPPPPRTDLGGRWDLRQDVQSTNYQPFAGMTLGYRVNLSQDGNRVHGRGFKTSENGVLLLPSQRTPIEVEGRIEGNDLVLNFTEIGRDRTSRGTIRYRLGPGGAMRGRFSSDAADSSGTSSAHRVP
jgi:serine/threonine-protein kinase